MDSYSLSIVITSYTMERFADICGLLDSIKSQTNVNRYSIETVFVAERSIELYKKVKAYIEKIGLANAVMVFNDGEPGQSSARNLGVLHSNGDVVAFVDDDVVLFPDWAEKMLESYKDDATIGVTGSASPLWENGEIRWFPQEFYWIISCTAWNGWNELRPVRCAGGMNMSFRAEAFNYCHFSQTFGHIAQEQKKVGPVVDDAEFSINLRLKTKKVILYNPQVRVQHRVYGYRLSHKFIRGQAYWQGFSKALLRKVYSNDPDTHALLRERELLRQILLHLLPQIIGDYFTNPRSAWKKSGLVTRVLYYVALGYSASAVPWFTGYTTKYFTS